MNKWVSLAESQPIPEIGSPGCLLAHTRKAERARQKTLPGVSVRRSDALRPEQQAEAAAAMLDLLAGRITSAEYARRLAAL